jgi:hypothetical protein
MACRGGASAADEVFEVLNEVVLSRGANPYLSKIEVGAMGLPAQGCAPHIAVIR